MTSFKLTTTLKALQRGDIIVYPTDTLYALGANIFDNAAIKKLFKIKKRPFSVPLPIAVGNISEMKKIAYVNTTAEKIVKQFLPGTVTLLLPKKNLDNLFIAQNLKKIALRIPNNQQTLELLNKFGPLTVTSANIHGMDPAYGIKNIIAQFKDQVSVYINAGKLNGQPSTIIDVTVDPPVIVREGQITLQEIMDMIDNG